MQDQGTETPWFHPCGNQFGLAPELLSQLDNSITFVTSSRLLLTHSSEFKSGDQIAFAGPSPGAHLVESAKEISYAQTVHMSIGESLQGS